MKYAQVVQWFGVLVMFIATLPSREQRELYRQLQAHQLVPNNRGTATSMEKTAFVFTACVLLYTLISNMIRTRRGNATRQAPAPAPAPSPAPAVLPNRAVEMELADVRRNRNGLRRAYVHEFVKNVLNQAIHKDILIRVARLNREVTKDVLNAQQKHDAMMSRVTTNRNIEKTAFLRSIAVYVDKERELQRKIATLERSLTTLSNAAVDVASLVRKVELLEGEHAVLQAELARSEKLHHEASLRIITLERNKNTMRRALNSAKQRENSFKLQIRNLNKNSMWR